MIYRLPLPVRIFHWLWTGKQLPKFVQRYPGGGREMVRTAPQKRQKKFNPDNFEPIVIGGGQVEEVKEVVLFSIIEDDGTRTDYLIPNKVRFSLTLEAGEKITELGDVQAGYWMLKQLIGASNFDALKKSDKLEKEQFDRIVELASKIVLGESEGKAQ